MRRSLAELRAHPRHVVLGAVCLGLAAGDGAAVAGVVLAVAVLLVGVLGPPHATAPRTLLTALGCAAALVLSSAAGAARISDLDATALPPSFGHAVGAEVTLLEPFRRRPFGARTAVARLRGERVLLRAGSRVRAPRAEVGELLTVRGGLEPPDMFATAIRAHALLRADEITLTGRRRGGLSGVVDGIRARANRALERDLPSPVDALLRGMVLGDDSALPDAVREDFRTTGLSHLTAASGQNVLLLATLALGAGALLGAGLRLRLAAALVLVLLYVPLAGAGPSIQRAGIMGAAGLVASLAGRPASRWYAVLLAAGGTLALEPRSWQDPGWQLSFAAVVSLLLLVPGLRERLGRRVPQGPADAMAVTTAATLATAPLLALHFDRVSLVSLPANVLAAPLVAPIMWLGMLSAAAGQVAVGLAAPLNALAALPVAALLELSRAAASVPGASVAAGPLPVLLVSGVGLAAITGRWRRRPAGTGSGRGGLLGRTRPALGIVAVAIAVVSFPSPQRGLAAPPPGRLRVSFLDVGQGDATLLQDGARAVLVDTGPPEAPIVARLREAGVPRLDALLITHVEADHAGGAAAVLRALPVGVVLDGRDGRRTTASVAMEKALRETGVRTAQVTAGMTLRVGALRLRTLWPPLRPDRGGPAVGDDDPNLRAVVTEASDGPYRVLLTSDAEATALPGLALDDVDVLKVAHHGSADEGLPALLGQARPEVAVVSVGRNNPYGHPAPETLRRLGEAGAEVYRTDRDGTVRIDAAPSGLKVSGDG